MQSDEITRTVWALSEPELAREGYELIEVEFGRQDSATVLRVFIDKSGGGISLEDCSKASHLLSPLLDAGDFIKAEYFLEVSSPGLDRPLRKPEHFVQFAGQAVKVQTHAPVGGRSRFSGLLKGFEDGLVLLEVEDKAVSIHVENIKKARLNA